MNVQSSKRSNDLILLEIEFNLPVADKNLKVEARYYLYEENGKCNGIRPLGKYPKNVINRIRREGVFFQDMNFESAYYEFIEGYLLVQS